MPEKTDARMSRQALHPRDPEIVGLARGAGDGARQAALLAARTALARNPVSRAPVVEALGALDEGDHRSLERVRGELTALLTELDQAYWNLSDALGSGPRAEVDTAFARARAVNALVCAVDSDPAEAAVGAIYEAQASLPQPESDEFLGAVKDLLRTFQVRQ